jgi:hypothetical protein
MANTWATDVANGESKERGLLHRLIAVTAVSLTASCSRAGERHSRFRHRCKARISLYQQSVLEGLCMTNELDVISWYLTCWLFVAGHELSSTQMAEFQLKDPQVGGMKLL